MVKVAYIQVLLMITDVPSFERAFFSYKTKAAKKKKLGKDILKRTLNYVIFDSRKPIYLAVNYCKIRGSLEDYRYTLAYRRTEFS